LNKSESHAENKFTESAHQEAPKEDENAAEEEELKSNRSKKSAEK
jgi:hypothetical protein